MSDKPAYIQNLPRFTPHVETVMDNFRERQYESLLSVDDWVGRILQALSETGRLDNTLIVFMSDNGLLLGEHRKVMKKLVPYEESIRVPFIVRWDAAGWDVPRSDPHLVANVDLAGTWASAAGMTMPGFEGKSLLPLLSNPSSPWRQRLLLEHEGAAVPAYCGVRGTSFVYVQYATGEEELYDLRSDPSELRNLAGDPLEADVLARMRRFDHNMCNPVPPGFSWSH